MKRGRLFLRPLLTAAALCLAGACSYFTPEIADLDTDPLRIEPAAATLAPFEEVRFAAKGGRAPYTLVRRDDLSGGSGTLAADGTYRAGDRPGSRDIVEATDAAGRTVQAVVSTGPALAVTPPEVSIAPGGTAKLTVVGGKPPYTATIAADAGGVSENSVAVTGSTLEVKGGPSGGAVDLVTATDATGTARAVARIVRLDALGIAPRFPEVAPAQALSLVIGGGQPPYALEDVQLNSGTGAAAALQSANVVAYRAGQSGGVSDRFRLRDANQMTLDVEVSVLPALEARYLRAPVPDTETDSPLVTGGKPPYYFVLLRDFSGAMLDPNTGLYRPGRRTYIADVVRVSDTLGQHVDLEVRHYRSLPTNGTPWDITAGDLDGDGRADIAASLVPGGTLALYRNAAAGEFIEAGTVAGGQRPRGVAIADLDDDGAPDLVNADELGDALRIHYGVPGSPFTFEAPVALAVGRNPRSLTVADLDGDGRPDIVVPGVGSSDLTFFTNKGGRTFVAATVPVLTGARFARALPGGGLAVISDTYVGAAASAGGVQIVRPGAGGYTADPPIDAPGAGWDLDAADLDGDGTLDLVYPVSLLVDGLVCYIKDVLAQTTAACVSIGGQPLRVRATDLDADGVVDVVVLDQTESAAVFVRNITSQPTLHVERFAIGRSPWSFVLADFNGDGFPDLATGNGYSNDIGVLLADLGRSFAAGPRPGPVGYPVGASVTLTPDGLPEIWVPAFYGKVVRRFTADADGAFTAGDLLTGHVYTGAAAGVLPERDRLVVATTQEDDLIQVVRLPADGGAAQTVEIPFDNAFKSAFVRIAGEALPAIAVAASRDAGDGETAIVSVTSLDPLAAAITARLASCRHGVSPAAADLDGDGTDELVFPCTSQDKVEIWRRDAGGAFALSTSYATPRWPTWAAVGRLTGGDAPDIAVTCGSDDTVVIHRPDGAGGYVEHSRLAAPLMPDGAVVADFDRDGRDDLAVTARLSNDLIFFFRQPDGSLAESRRLKAGLGPRWPAVFDVDADGLPDIVMPNMLSDDVSIFYAPRPEEAPL